MYPSTPNPNHQSFTFTPQNVNHNYFFHSLPQNQPPSTSPNPPVLDLHATLSSLNDLINLSQQTLHSLSNLLSPSSSTQNDTFLHSITKNANLIRCPFNPHHFLPPESLFLHSLHCPSSLNLDSLLESLNYPKTLESSAELQSGNRFVQSLQDPNTELCFSLDDYIDFGSNFFYKDCPCVVNLSDVDSVRRTFTVPGILSVECANFVVGSGGGGKEIKGFRILPSDLWAMRNEIEAWGDYPCTYSYIVLCAILGLKVVEESDLRRWAIKNSPGYGVVIDVHMRDHIFVLFRLCLKAIMREAFGLAELLGNIDVKEQELEVIFKGKSFECPVLVQVLMWFVSQLSVLYGEMNGKFFAINFLKQCILEAAPRLLLFSMEQKGAGSSNSIEVSQKLDVNGSDISNVKLEEPLEGSAVCEQGKMVGETVDGGVIFVSQVAAAVAALHERSMLEEKIKGLRVAQPLTRYQRVAEYAYVSKRADEERKKRPNYKPIIEHDGLPRQQSFNQETSKTKTRAELLAEERDYKRRRMSYRGKKLKRTTLQVMRDIIEDYMEEIKLAGGIGCFVKEAEGVGMFPSEPPSAHGITMDIDELRKSNSDSYEASRGSPNPYRKQSHIRSTTFEDHSHKDYEQWRRGARGHLDDQRRSIDRDKRGGEYYSGSSERHGSHRRSHERSSH